MVSNTHTIFAYQTKEMEIGTQIRQHRERLGVSQTRLCEMAKLEGFERSDISKFENNKRFPSRETLKKLCEALEVEVILKPIKSNS